MNIKKKLAWVLGFLITAGVLVAQVPNKFKAGDTLTATKINDNFKYISRVVKDGAGNLLGQLGVATPNGIYLTNSNGYRYAIDVDGKISAAFSGQNGGGPVGSAVVTTSINNTCPPIVVSIAGPPITTCYYTENTCNIPAPSNTIYMDLMPGGLAALDTTGTLYYVDKSTTAAPSIIYTYSTTPPSCNATKKGYIPSVNNPTVTGVNSTSFPLPINIVNE